MAASGAKLLEVEGLETRFVTKRGVAKVVDKVSFSLNRGETLGLVGESACGKSTTALSIMRMLPKPAGKIVGGRVRFMGDDLLVKSESEMARIRGKEISMIFQDPLSSLNPAFTVGDQVGEAIYLHQGLRGRSLKDKVVEALRLVNIPAPERRINDYPHQMSGGMRQRVVGAIAFSCQPALIIADEPTTALDVTIQAQYLELLKDIQVKTGVALLLITHDLGVVARMCDNVAVMYAGRIVEHGSVRDIFHRPHHPYTKALLACLPDRNPDGRLINIQGQPPNLVELPQGCSYRPRCSVAGKMCNEAPADVAVGDGHFVKCWNANATN